jgi:hypothetical protein
MQPPSSPRDLSSIDPTPAFSFVEVALPMMLNHAWVAYACRVATLAKPRWCPVSRVWTTHGIADERIHETISISAHKDSRHVRVCAEWNASERRRESDAARRVVTALMTGMQWAVAKRAGRDRPL